MNVTFLFLCFHAVLGDLKNKPLRSKKSLCQAGNIILSFSNRCIVSYLCIHVWDKKISRHQTRTFYCTNMGCFIIFLFSPTYLSLSISLLAGSSYLSCNLLGSIVVSLVMAREFELWQLHKYQLCALVAMPRCLNNNHKSLEILKAFQQPEH